MLRSRLCDYIYAYIAVNVTILVTGADADDDTKRIEK